MFAHARQRCGFTLIEIIVAIAIIAVLAGAITPLAFRELMQAREDATLRELDALSDALNDFYEDTGRFPSESEGLAALVLDPGVTGWQGPYVESDRGDPVAEVSTDEFGQAYVYDLAPQTNPAGAADAILASGGTDGTVTFGSAGHLWTIDGNGDDLLALVSTGPLDRDKIRLCAGEIEAIGDAARSYYQDNAAFPTTAAQLVPDFLDAGIGGGAFVDPWRSPYALVLITGGTAPDELSVRSRGPDRQDDAGGDDDISLSVSCVPPGRKTTQWKLDIAQTALNNQPSLALTGVWTSDRAALGLTGAFDRDGWGNVFGVNVAARTVYSVGPDGNGVLVTDNLPAGVGP